MSGSDMMYSSSIFCVLKAKDSVQSIDGVHSIEVVLIKTSIKHIFQY